MRVHYLVLTMICGCLTADTVKSDDESGAWAVLGTPAARDSGLVDLLTVRLTAADRFRLVERDAIEAVLNEQALAGLLQDADASSCVKLGKLVRAQRLVMVDLDTHAGRRCRRVRRRPGSSTGSPGRGFQRTRSGSRRQ